MKTLSEPWARKFLAGCLLQVMVSSPLSWVPGSAGVVIGGLKMLAMSWAMPMIGSIIEAPNMA